MGLKERFEKIVDLIDSHRKTIVTASLSILGLIFLMIIFFVSSDEFSVSKESSILLKHIESRKYGVALNYYEDLEKEFSPSKMERFDKNVSKKINKLMISSGDKFINTQITKEHYIGLISTVNALRGIDVDLKKIVDQASRVSEMYKSENLSYDIAMSYINTASSLDGMGNDLDVYKQNITVLYDSRKMFEAAEEDKNIKKYHEAIKSYDKVLEEDKKYYDLAQNAKKECIGLMYDYYIEQADEANELGNYEEALQYIGYLKPYYQEDEKLLDLESKYQKNLSLYTLTPNDIINLIAKKSGKDKEGLTVTSFQQMIGGSKYYYVEVFEYEELIDEILVDAKSRNIYSYKGSNKDYNSTYSDGYFRVSKDSEIQFAISSNQAQTVLENKFKDKDYQYKNISMVSKDKAYKYIEDKEGLDSLLEKDKDVYYYALVGKGIFKKKEVYVINMYNKKVYSTSEYEIKGY
ncbi:UbiD family decarboxylase [Romboutsia weinsteinii]|uniref:UbiD family decarboxylase n=1 Tax=Romboutsia weinsteinii TaxID=2020949 RepID=A0A371J9L6_9FIRM|nr:UbiD family decarboxylase [Romboutsia weinsteinii]RDY29460.1 UbiD family decarboxylase [Romboutsia weinsteinii]